VNEDDCSFLLDLADAGTSLLLGVRQKNKCHKRNNRKNWVTETQSTYALLMDVKQKTWRCRSSLFAAKRFLGTRQHKGRLKLTDVG